SSGPGRGAAWNRVETSPYYLARRPGPRTAADVYIRDQRTGNHRARTRGQRKDRDHAPNHRAHREDRQTDDVLFGLRRRGCTPDRVRARVAGAVDQLAASVALPRRPRLPGGRAGYAGVWPIERISAPRGLRAGGDREGH